MSGTRIAAIGLLSADPLETARFYVRTFGCREAGGATELLFGDQRLEVRQARVAAAHAAPSNATAFQHCAIVVSDMRAAMARLDASPGWTAISLRGPERLPEASGGATAFKFRDPDGHPLELLQFPPDKVPAVWRRAGTGPFLGIDHSAITVSDTDRAIAFWREFGFRVGERHVNRGAEQARLDGFEVPEARVEVTALVPAGGAPPHLELLCYETPAPLRAAAPDGSPLATTLALRDAPARDGPMNDPDGHRLRIDGR